MPKTILVADGSSTIRRVVELAFTGTDVRVESAASGREALEQLRASPPDLVLADVVMPEPSGYEICRRVKRSPRPVPVLLLAGAFEPFDPERAREAGADGHMVKPFESRALVEKVTELLSRPAAAVADPSGWADVEALEPVLGTSAGEAGPAVPLAPPEPPLHSEQAKGVTPAPADPPATSGITDVDVAAIAEAVVRRLSDRVLREIAWEVVPDLAEVIIRERLRELEREGGDRR